MTKPLNPATSDERALLAEPSSLQVLGLLSRNGWLSLDVKELNQYFGSEDHEARTTLLTEARSGGKYGASQCALVLIFLVLGIVVTSFVPLSNPVVFSMWGALGIAIGLLIARYPAALDKLRKGSPDA